ncbi:MAG: response regulator [Telmatospirillum sp.]|nr:response regulator [Telmatospirillum sp.]
MDALLIEDDEPKSERITEFLTNLSSDLKISHMRSYQSGLRSLLAHTPNLILLDMNLPNYDITAEETGGKIMQFAGREFLRQMMRRNIKAPVIVVTAFEFFGEGIDSLTLEELDRELTDKYSGNYLGYVYYHTILDDWKIKLPALIKERYPDLRT